MLSLIKSRVSKRNKNKVTDKGASQMEVTKDKKSSIKEPSSKLESENKEKCLSGCNLKNLPSCEKGFKILESGCGSECSPDTKKNLLSLICNEPQIKRLIKRKNKKKNCRHCIKSEKYKKPQVCCKCKKCDYITDDPCDGSCFNIFRL